MFNPVEHQIIDKILKETTSIDLATMAVVFYRLNPKLQMNPIDLGGMAAEISNEIESIWQFLTETSEEE